MTYQAGLVVHIPVLASMVIATVGIFQYPGGKLNLAVDVMYGGGKTAILLSYYHQGKPHSLMRDQL